MVKLDKIDFRFIEINYELHALEQYMDSIESQLPHLIRIEEEKVYDDLREKGYENDEIERQIAQQQLDDFIDNVLPRYFFSQILVTLWAIFESAIVEIANEIKDHKKQGIYLNDINGDFLERTNKYFNHILKFPIKTRDSAWQHLRMFYILRNAIAHANGRMDNIKSKRDVNKIKKWTKDNIGIDDLDGNLSFSPHFVKKLYSIVFNMINVLIERVRSRYPDAINW